MDTNQKVWFITGGKKGLGAAMVKEAFANGYQVVVVANLPLRLLISEGSIPAVDAYYKTRFTEFE